MVFPESLLINLNMLSYVLSLCASENDYSEFLSTQELALVHAEACAYLGIETVPISLVQLLLSQRLQIYIFKDTTSCICYPVNTLNYTLHFAVDMKHSFIYQTKLT